MPSALIEVCRKRADNEIEPFLQAVYEAQLKALNMPASDRQLRYVEHNFMCFFTPPDSSENFILNYADVFWLSGCYQTSSVPGDHQALQCFGYSGC
jgi:hypothetical protein